MAALHVFRISYYIQKKMCHYKTKNYFLALKNTVLMLLKSSITMLFFKLLKNTSTLNHERSWDPEAAENSVLPSQEKNENRKKYFQIVIKCHNITAFIK